MRCLVVFDHRCRFDVGERTPDRILQITEFVRALMQLLGKHAGYPPGFIQLPGRPLDEYMWYDRNWLVAYRISDERRYWFRRRRTITILSVEQRSRDT